MKRVKYTILSIFFLGFIHPVLVAQEAKKELSLNLGYFNNNYHLQYLKASAKTKLNGRFQPVAGLKLSFYITDESPSNLLGKGVTNEHGEAVVYIPSLAKDEWNKSANQSFLAVSEASSEFEATKASADIVKTKMKIDTATDRNIVVTLFESKKGSWVPVKGVDMKVAVKRLGGNLNVSETPTYTTDSVGALTAQFARDSLPGDANGNIILVASVEDNDVYGNLTLEQSVPWGTVYKYVSDFDKRTLFARRGRSPIWLGFMAYSIAIAVWGIILYLVFQIFKLRRLGA